MFSSLKQSNESAHIISQLEMSKHAHPFNYLLQCLMHHNKSINLIFILCVCVLFYFVFPVWMNVYHMYSVPLKAGRELPIPRHWISRWL